jgi:hypothetical protein
MRTTTLTHRLAAFGAALTVLAGAAGIVPTAYGHAAMKHPAMKHHPKKHHSAMKPAMKH